MKEGKEQVKMQTNNMPLWVKITDAAKMLGVTRFAIRAWIKQGVLEQAGVGRKLHYVTAESLSRLTSKR